MRFRTILKFVLLFVIVVTAAGAILLSRMDFSRYRPLIAEKVKEATGRDFEIAGDLKLDIGLAPAIVVEDVRLQNAVFGTRAEMIKARKLEAHVALLPLLMGDIEISRLALVGPDILLETDEQGRANWDFSRNDDEPPRAGHPSAEHAVLDLPDLGAVSIENGLLTYRNGVTGKTTKIEVVRFDGWSESRDAPLAFDLTAAYDGVPFHVAGHMGPFSALGGPGPFSIDLTADLTDFQLALKGTVNRPLSPTSSDFSIEANASTLKGLSALFKTVLPPGPLALTGHAASKDGALTISDIEATLGGSDLAGTLRLEGGKERPWVTASLTSKTLDVADLQAAEAPAEGNAKKPQDKAPPPDDGRLFSTAPLPLDLLKLVDGKLDAKVDHLVMGAVALNRATFSAALQDGRLSIQPITGELAQGDLVGAVALDSTDGGGAKVSLQVSKLDVNTLAQAFDVGDILTGRVDVTANLAGHGRSLRGLMSSLDGKASVVMGKGQVKSSYVELMGADLLRFAASAGAGDTTNVNCLVGRFNITKGFASTHDILFDTNHMTVKGEGGISLGAERVGLKFTPRPKEMSLINLAMPWRVEGPLRQPQVHVDETEVATRAAGALLSVINPLALLVPMVSAGTGDQNPCVVALETPKQARSTGGKAAGKPAKKDSNGLRGMIDSLLPGR